MNSATRTKSARQPRQPRQPGQPVEPCFQAQFLHPRFFGTWCWLLLIRVIMYLPRRWVMALGAFIGDRVRVHNQKRRRIAEININMCFPQLSDQQRHQLLIEHFHYYGRGLLDIAVSLWGSQSRRDRLCQLERRDWLLATLRRQPVIMVAYHLTTMDIGGSMLARFHPCVSMMKRARNPLLTWQLWKGRTHLDKDNLQLIMRDQGLRPLVRAMKTGHTCLFVPDEDFGAPRNTAHTVFTPFFGVQTSTLTVVSRLAKLTGAVVLPSATRLDPRTGSYVMSVGDPLEHFPGDDPAADAAALNRAMQALISRAPAQYMWTFRWFKTRPDGAPDPYKPTTTRGAGK